MKYTLKNKYFILFLFVVINWKSFSQSYDDSSNPNEWMRKYWFYKSRLNNDFVKVGRGAGESLVFNERGYLLSDFNPSADVTFKIGDGTSTLGYYIAMLSLEYYLLKIKHQKIDSTLYELACAIDAINRLDLCAEKILTDSSGTGGNGILNGFFVRDDVYENFVKDNYDHFNYFSAGIHNNSGSRGFASMFNKGCTDLYHGTEEYGSSYQTLYHQKQDIKSSFTSQDQVYALLYGLAFVRKFISENVQAKDRYGNIFYFRDGETYVSKAAKNIIKRIVDNIRNPKKIDGSGCGGLDWRITRPDNCNSSSLLGHDPWSYPLAETECVLDHLNFGVYDVNSPVFLAPSLCKSCYETSAQYHTWYSLTGGYDVWWTLTNAFSPWGLSSPNTNVMLVDIAAACNCIYLQPITITGTPLSFISSFLCLHKYLNRTPERIDHLSSIGNYYWYLFHGPLGRYVLHGGELKVNNDGSGWKNRPRFLLNEMNPCNHFNLGGTNNYSSLGWSTDTRLDHPERIGNNDFKGEYSSVDFMLYFNLWTLASNEWPSLYTNLSHYYINSSTISGGYYNPPSVSLTSINSYKTPINAYETIYIEKTKLSFYTNENYMRAGKEIILKATSTPGDGSETWIKPGIEIWSVSDGSGSSIADAGIRFYIKKYNCALDNGNYNPYIDSSYCYKTTRGGDAIINTKHNTLNNHDTSFISIIPHYIEYSKEDAQTLSEIKYESENDKEYNLSSGYLQIIPNPSENKIIIISDVEYDEIKIFNVTGTLVKSIVGIEKEKTNEIDVSNWSPGMYFLSIYQNHILVSINKFIKK